MRARGVVIEALALAAIAALPLLADAFRTPRERCAQDGAVIDPAYAVVADFGGGVQRRFCGVVCADHWMMRSGVTAHRIAVTDCVTGRPVDAGGATYVETATGWREGVPDPVRAFASRADAKAHVRAYGGEILAGARRPLQHAAFGRWESAQDGR